MEATSIQNQNRHAVFPIFLWGFVIFCLFGFLAVAAVRWFGNFQSYDERRAVERAKVLAEYRKTMDANLNTLKWADDQKQAAQIPIAEAMKITMKRLNARKVSASSISIVPSTAVPAEVAPILSEGESALEPSTQQSGPNAGPKPEMVPGETSADAAGDSAESKIVVPTSGPAPTAEFLPDAPEAPRQTTQE